jgi:hypothetical protein
MIPTRRPVRRHRRPPCPGNVRPRSTRNGVFRGPSAPEFREAVATPLPGRPAAGELEAVLAEIPELEGSAIWTDRITAMLAGPASPAAMRPLSREAKTWADAAFADETRREQRTAVLRALAIAGYEVREGMAAAWEENGRIVLQKPNDSQYGIEVSAPTQGNAFQTRVVAFSESRDPRRDLEVEQTWCGEFQKARELLESDGSATTLLQAHESGTIPLKRVPLAAPQKSQQEVIKQRSL